MDSELRLRLALVLVLHDTQRRRKDLTVTGSGRGQSRSVGQDGLVKLLRQRLLVEKGVSARLRCCGDLFQQTIRKEQEKASGVCKAPP